MTTERQITRDELLERGRAAYDARAWSTAVELLLAADREAPLDLDELELLGDVGPSRRARRCRGAGRDARVHVGRGHGRVRTRRPSRLVDRHGLHVPRRDCPGRCVVRTCRRLDREVGARVRRVRLPPGPGRPWAAGNGTRSRRCLPDIPADLSDRRAVRRRRPGHVRTAGPRRVADRDGRAGPRDPPPRRGDGRRDGRRGVAVGGRDGLLRDHRRLLRDLRHPAGAGMDDRAHGLVCLPTRHRVSRPLPHLPRRAHALPRRLDDRRRRGAARPTRARGTAGPSGHRRRALRGRPSSIGSAAASKRPNAHTRRPPRSAIEANRASPSSGSHRVGPPRPAT